jgi:hypothetical protein
MEVALARPLK